MAGLRAAVIEGPRVDDNQELRDRWAGWQRAIEVRDIEAAGGFLADAYALELV